MVIFRSIHTHKLQIYVIRNSVSKLTNINVKTKTIKNRLMYMNAWVRKEPQKGRARMLFIDNRLIPHDNGSQKKKEDIPNFETPYGHNTTSSKMFIS